MQAYIIIKIVKKQERLASASEVCYYRPTSLEKAILEQIKIDSSKVYLHLAKNTLS